jgi:hypothetical protein
VCYYVRHTFAGRAHDFAVARWFDFADYRRLAQSARGQQQSRMPHPSRWLQDTLHDYPIVTLAPREPDIRDVIPVHRITGRWIAMRSAVVNCQLVCPIRSKVHH